MKPFLNLFLILLEINIDSGVKLIGETACRRHPNAVFFERFEIPLATCTEFIEFFMGNESQPLADNRVG